MTFLLLKAEEIIPKTVKSGKKGVSGLCELRDVVVKGTRGGWKVNGDYG
jgi:hypothetical protein